MEVGSIVGRVKLILTDWNRGHAQVMRSLKQMTRRMHFWASDAWNAGKKMTAGLTLPIVALGAAAIKTASAFGEIKQRFDVVFQGILGKANQVTAAVAKNWDLAKVSAMDYMSATADMFIGLGLAREQALELSRAVVELSADITSFRDIEGGVAAAMDAFQSGMAGNSRALRKLGVYVNFGSDEFKKLMKSVQETTGASEKAAQMIAVVMTAFKQSPNAIGDYARTFGSATNVTRALKEALKDFFRVLGLVLIRVMKVPQRLMAAKNALKSFTKAIREAPQWVISLITRIATLVAVIGPLFLGIGAVAFALAGMLAMLTITATIFGAIGAVIHFLSPLIFSAAGAFGALGLAIFKPWKMLTKMTFSWKNFKRAAVESMKALELWLQRVMPLVWGFLKNLPRNIDIMIAWVPIYHTLTAVN